MKILLVGGAGLLGTHLYPLLEQQGHEVAIADIFSSSRKDRVPKNYKVLVSDSTQLNSFSHSFNIFKPDILIICVAYTAVNDVIYSKFEDIRTVLHTASVISNVITPKLKHVYYCSSSEVYGGPDTKRPLKETRNIIQPASFHGASKLSAETMISSACHLLDVPYTCFRIFDMFGPRITYSRRNDVVNFLVDYFIADSSNDQLGLAGAKVLRDFIHVSDVASAINKAVIVKPIGTFNLGSGKGTTLSEISKELLKKINCKFPPIPVESKIFQYSTLADIRKISAALNWQPEKDLFSSLDELIEFRKAEAAFSSDPTRMLNSMRGLG